MIKKLLFLLVLLLTATTGAWAQESVAKDIVVSPESGTNINDAIKDALGTNGDRALNITINLAKGGTYTVTETIVPSASITINGNGATIDASGLTTHFIKMNKTPSDEYKVESGQYIVTTPSKIENVTITGLTKALFYDNGTQYVFKDFTFNNCLINYSEQGSLIISLAASMVINFTITNSTFYCKDKFKCTANCIAMSGKRPWQVTGFEDKEGKLLVDHNTFYNVAYKKKLFETNTLKGQNKYKYEFNSNIFVNVSNKKIYGNLTNNKNQLGTDGKNTYLWDGEFFSETNYNGDAGLQTDPLFKDADNGDFTVGRSTEQFANKTGDTRWTTFKVMMKDGVMDADKWTVKVGEGEAQDFPVERLDGGEKITVTYTGTKKILGMKVENKAAAPTYTLLSAATTSDVGKVVCAAGHLHDAKTAVPSGCTAVGILGKVTTTGHGLILALQDATTQEWVTVNGWASETSYAGTTLKVLPNDAARGTNLTSYTTLGETTVSNWAVAQKSDYEAIFQNLGSTTNVGGGYTCDGNVNAYITTGVGGAAISFGCWSATEYDNAEAWYFYNEYWSQDSKDDENRRVRPVLGF